MPWGCQEEGYGLHSSAITANPSSRIGGTHSYRKLFWTAFLERQEVQWDRIPADDMNSGRHQLSRSAFKCTVCEFTCLIEAKWPELHTWMDEKFHNGLVTWCKRPDGIWPCKFNVFSHMQINYREDGRSGSVKRLHDVICGTSGVVDSQGHQGQANQLACPALARLNGNNQ